MRAAEADALARAVLHGHARTPAFAPHRMALAAALPRAAEELRCTQGADLEAAGRALSRLWSRLEEDELSRSALGTPQLAAGCLEAAEILGIRLAPKMRPSPFPTLPEREADFSMHRDGVSPPRVLAPLANDSPARVFYSTRPGEPAALDDAIQGTAPLVQHLLQADTPRWSFDRRAPGRSKMAALFLRALLERWPEATSRLAPNLMRSGGVPVFGITGELDDSGRVGPVEGLADKVRGFFALHPEGRFFVPAFQWREARRLLDELRPPDKTLQRYEWEKRWWKVQPFLGTLDLLVRLGLSAPSSEETRLFEKLRTASRKVLCWNGAVRDVSETLALSLHLPGEEDAEHKAVEQSRFLEEVREGWLSGRARSAFIEGGPGSGKSIVMRRLHAYLIQETPLLGPSLRVDARNLAKLGWSLERALHASYFSFLTEQECQRLVALARSPALAGSVWLLIDGLDEVSAEHRGLVREILSAWPGPSIVAARPLPNELPGSPHVRVGTLSSAQQKQLFTLEEKPGHWSALAGSYDLPGYAGDRRKAMVSDLCSTPLGVSLLAMLPQEELDERLDVPSVLRKSIVTLLERAEKAGRIPSSVRRKVATRGLDTLGAAAWSMLRRGETTLTQSDLEVMHRDSSADLVDAVHEVLENSDLVQRVGPDAYEFSHKSLAEYCAALYLVRSDKAESELLPLIGEPGADAVAFHFGSLIPPERLSVFLRQLISSPPRPMSSLTLATRLLVANGPERVAPEVVRAVIVKRVRFESHKPRLSWHSPLIGGLGQDTEMWLAVERWARELRPYAHELIAACPPAVARFLRGEHLPLQENEEGSYTLRGDEDQRLFGDVSFAEELVSRLELELPLEVTVRLGSGKSRLLSRPSGPWVLELERLFDTPDDTWSKSADCAASVWAEKAPAKRRLERLDVLSQCSPAAVQPLLETVRLHGDKAQKREALLRAAINTLEHGKKDEEGDWVRTLRFARKLRNISASELLRQWELLWACGLIGDDSERSKTLDPLYAEFLDDPCGPARWRALVALARVQGTVEETQLRRALRDPFRGVRVEALAQLAMRGLPISPVEIMSSLVSLDDHERWVACEAIGAGRSAPIEWVLDVLAPRSAAPKPPSRASAEDDAYGSYRDSKPAPAPPWQRALLDRGEHAHRELSMHLRERVRSSDEFQAFLKQLDGPHAPEAEKILDAIYIEEEVGRSVLASGGPRQRQLIARKLHRASVLSGYMNDPDPEVARCAREAIEWEQRNQEFHLQHRASLEQDRRREDAYQVRERRPVLSLEALERYDSFRELWKALPEHNLPFRYEAQIAEDKEERARRSEPDVPEAPPESVSSRQRKPILQKLAQLYRHHHQPLLLAGLKDDELAPFSVALLREHLPAPEVLALIPRGGDLTERAVEILRGTPHATTAAQLLREAFLSGRLKPAVPAPAQDEFSPELSASHEESRFTWLLLGSLQKLDGLAGLLSIVESDAPEKIRRHALYSIQSGWNEWERTLSRPAELLAWAHQRQQSPDEEMRVIALRLLAIIGSAEDADRWRPALIRKEEPPRVLAAAIWLVSRFGTEHDLPLFRQLLEHSPQAASEAISALARVGGAGVVEELVRYLETPPAPLSEQRRHPLLNADISRWVPAALEVIIRFGDGAQAKRAARVLEQDSDVWRIALRHFRLPEHVLFIAGHLGSKDPGADHDNGYDEAHKVLLRMIRRAGKKAARRVMIESSLWGDYFRRCFDEFLTHIAAEDVDLLLARLREHPDDGLAISWLSQHPGSEAALDAIWREKTVEWWA